MTNPDANLFKKIERVARCWRDTAALDEEARDARRFGKVSEAQLLTEGSDAAATKAEALSWEVLLMTDAATTAGHMAKRRMVANCGFDDVDLIKIAWHLGHEAARLGVGKEMPALTSAGTRAAE